MMSSFADYTDGIPVKISERYKKPPLIELGRSEVECETRTGCVLDTCRYSFAFEECIISKMTELRAAKETLRSEQRHRVRLLEEAKQRYLDEVAAAEEVERLRQLSVSGVSYPSVDDLGDTRDINNDADVESGLLRPVRVHEPFSPSHPLDDTDPLTELRRRAAAYRPTFMRAPHLTSLSVSDFEHDTSSPFDNAELESIDDLAQLEQILRQQTPPAPADAALPLPTGFLDNHIVCGASGYMYCAPTAGYSTYVPRPPPSSRSHVILDIVRKLNEEVTCERLRAQLHSRPAAPTPPPPATPALPVTDALPNVYNDLPPHLQQMCRTIENMGFPRERVAHVCSLLGDSDKKVIEGVLLVGQLLDLGFSEGRVAAALAKHHFNKDKALDDLIA